MTRIGIIGASSQVGSSVAFFLKKFSGTQVTCFIRSAYSKVFFELLGIDYRLIDKEDEAARMIGEMDVILDFGYPAGQLQEILGRSKENTGRILQAMKKGKTYIYMSSIMAYGMPENEKWIRQYAVPRSSYAYIKRSMEKFAAREGRRRGISVYNFRLGQVHGFLQSVSGSFRKKLSDCNIAFVDGRPEDRVNTIFIYPLCEAIMDCVKGVHRPGLYTLVSGPQWTLKELYDYYLQYYGLAVDIKYIPAGKENTGKGRGKTFFQKGMALARPYRAILETYLLMRFPAWMVSVKGRFRQMQLSEQGHEALKRSGYIDLNLLGEPSGKRISGSTAAPEKILQIEKEYEAAYYAALDTGRR